MLLLLICKYKKGEAFNNALARLRCYCSVWCNKDSSLFSRYSSRDKILLWSSHSTISTLHLKSSTPGVNSTTPTIEDIIKYTPSLMRSFYLLCMLYHTPLLSGACPEDGAGMLQGFLTLQQNTLHFTPQRRRRKSL